MYVLLCPCMPCIIYIPHNALKTIKLLLKLLHLSSNTVFYYISELSKWTIVHVLEYIVYIIKKVPFWTAYVWLVISHLHLSAETVLRDFTFLNMYGFLHDNGGLWLSKMVWRIHGGLGAHVTWTKWNLDMLLRLNAHVVKNLLLVFMLFEETNRNLIYSHTHYM